MRKIKPVIKIYFLRVTSSQKGRVGREEIFFLAPPNFFLKMSLTPVTVNLNILMTLEKSRPNMIVLSGDFKNYPGKGKPHSFKTHAGVPGSCWVCWHNLIQVLQSQ